MKKVYAINGSPRRNKNTTQMLDKALEGVKAEFPDAQVERINLFDLNFTSCKSCFACKRKDEKFLRTCALKDDLTPVLEKLKDTDALIFGSPIWNFSVSLPVKAFLKNNNFEYKTIIPFFTYSGGASKKKIIFEVKNSISTKDIKQPLFMFENGIILTKEQIIKWLNNI